MPVQPQFASPIWSPTVWSGDSEVIGSWKMIEISPPRIARISAPSGRAPRCRSARAHRILNRIWPPVMRRRRGRMPMIAWLTTDLPEPDSPTSATVPP
jgi:hypothetical protein